MGSAMEMRVRSSLNPNAEPFIPMAYRLVEDFSPLWWELVKTSPWFQDYWSTHHCFDGDEDGDDDQDLDDDDVDVDDLWVDDLKDSSSSSSSPFDFSAFERKLQNGVQMDVVDMKAMLRKLNLGIPHSISKERDSKYQGPASYYKNKKQQKLTKYAAPKSVIRCIQQPR